MIQNSILFQKDITGLNTYSMEQSTDIFSVTLPVSGEPQSLTAPAIFTSYMVRISPASGANVWIAINNGDASLPAGNTFAQTNCEQNIFTYTIAGGSNISICSDQNNTNVSISFYRATSNKL